MSEKRTRQWPLRQQVQSLKRPTLGAFGVAASFSDEQGNQFIICARTKQEVREKYLKICPGGEVDEKYFYNVTFIKSSEVVLEDEEL